MRSLDTMTADHITFGVELETVVPYGCITVGPYHRGAPVCAAPAFNGHYWKAERDVSIRPPVGFMACEFVSPILNGAEGVANLLAMIEWIRGIGGRVNASCGCHVHVGLVSTLGAADRRITAEYLRKLAGVVNINAEGVYAQTGTRRDLSGWANRLTDGVRQSLDAARRVGEPLRAGATPRRQILNLTNIHTRGTVEFRAFAGTLNPLKVLHHVWTCLFMAAFAKELKHVPWSGQGWNSLNGGNGEKALRGLHRKMCDHCLVGAMTTHKREMKAEALRLARKFDARTA